jgi:hypothetical protein
LNTIKRLIYFLPLLAISMWVFGMGQNFNTFSEFSKSEFSQLPVKKEITKITHSNYDEGEIIIIEAEPEIETDIEWLRYENTSCNFNSKIKEKKVQSQEFLNFSLKSSIPLYDLYCNWKFHLS